MKYYYLLMAGMFIVLMFFTVVGFQPYNLENCKEGVVVELTSQLAERTNLSRFQVALIANDGEVITLDTNGEIYYGLQIGDKVKTCQSIGSIIPVNKVETGGANIVETYIERIEE